MVKVLVTGSNGFLGQHLSVYLSTKGYKIIATGKGNCRIKKEHEFDYVDIDFSNQFKVEILLDTYKPNIVIHNAAMSKPDECENDKAACLLNNVETTKYIVDTVNKIGGKIIYVSTDFIFGENGPHDVDASPQPLNFYGESKLLAEQYVVSKANDWAIVRPVFIYGEVWDGMRPSFLHWVKNNVENNKPIKVVNDQLRTPTYVLDICKGIEAIIEQNKQGAFHLAGKDILSPYQMALTVCDYLGLNKELIISVTSETFPEPVKRAKRSGLKIEHSIQELQYNPVTFKEGVALTFGKS